MLPCVYAQGVQAYASERVQKLKTIIIDMAEYFNDSEIQKSACKAIHMLAQKDTQAGDYLGREGVCEAIIAAMMKHSTDKDVICWGLLAVSSLPWCKQAHTPTVGADNSTRLHHAGVCQMIATAMQNHSGNTAVLIAACTAVQALIDDR
jgi:hypothetical protein